MMDDTLIKDDKTIWSLYSNIPYELGLEAVNYMLEKVPRYLELKIFREFKIKSNILIVKINIVCFIDAKIHVFLM